MNEMAEETNEGLKEYRMACKMCGATLRLQGNEDALEKWLDKTGFMCPGRHVELGVRREYVELVDVMDIDKLYKWEPKSNRMYVDLHKIKGLEHCGFGIFKNPNTQERYDYEEDETGGRHYFII